MKRKKFKSKLLLNKETITNLNQIRGGGTYICQIYVGPHETEDLSDAKGPCYVGTKKDQSRKTAESCLMCHRG